MGQAKAWHLQRLAEHTQQLVFLQGIMRALRGQQHQRQQEHDRNEEREREHHEHHEPEEPSSASASHGVEGEDKPSAASADADSGFDDMLVSWEIHLFQGDASNATTMRSAKAFASYLFSQYNMPEIPFGANGVHDDIESTAVQESSWVFPDLQILPENADGEAGLQIIKQVYESVSLDDWQAKQEHMASNL